MKRLYLYVNLTKIVLVPLELQCQKKRQDYLTIDKESRIVKLNLDKLHIRESSDLYLATRVLTLAA
jgi:hypothetical protein